MHMGSMSRIAIVVALVAVDGCGAGRSFRDGAADGRSWARLRGCRQKPGRSAGAAIRRHRYESAIALSKFHKGQLQEIMIFPIWARHDGPISRRGQPMTAPPEIAQRILQRLQKLSAPFGTKIAIEGNVGIIRPSPGPASSQP
jgi:hypothetical protein